MLNSLATLYWRISGNASQAITCAKLAYQYAPDNAKVLTRVTGGTQSCDSVYSIEVLM